ncbi:SpoIIE family protein phosphatase [Streptomyces sp. AM 4-1-1]|uniref:SpoIIE family protein phosphatase n=1 Tax=Streptomyces sp. AM 4-1-1 TaxID=3028710 RepID=UPI0023B9CC1D|nr:SpoIIE family protein phosphatase [Streptomyces sp. AM 4-1-1]WEH37544.1 SpoIIE family protein phosphatase [Streptomyces sp. AM 4-1-1]
MDDAPHDGTGAAPPAPPGTAILDGTPAGIVMLDTDLRYVYVNPALARLNGVPAAEHLGRTIGEVLPDLDAREHLLRAVLADGEPREITSSGHTRASSGRERRYWHGVYHRLEREGRIAGVAGIVLEATASRSRLRELELARSYLSLLDTASVSIGTTLDMDTTCQELVDFVVPTLADAATVEVFPPDIGHSVRPAPPGVVRLRRAALAATPDLREAAKDYEMPGDVIDYQADSAVVRCLATNEPVVEVFTEEARLSSVGPSPERAAGYRSVGLHSVVAVPLRVRGRSLGVLSLARAGDSPDFTEGDDLIVARELADRTALDLDHARRYAHERAVAMELQRSLLSEPRAPHAHVEVATRYLPGEQGVLVGGDWFDVVPLTEGRHLKAMGDVMGHGVEAAVEMSHYRSLLRLLAEEELPPHRILEQLDTMVEKSGLDRAATCLLAIVDRFRGVCQVASAGHLPPLFIDPAPGGARFGEVATGPPLGTGLGGYRTTVAPCGPGTVLFMYTDGLVERRDESIDDSVNRLLSLRIPLSGSLDELLDEALERFGRNTEDDIALLASRIRDPDEDA